MKFLYLFIALGSLIVCIISIFTAIVKLFELFMYEKYMCKQNEKAKKKINKNLKKREKQLEKKHSISLEALKFEYSTIYNIVNSEIIKLNKDEYIINELYLMRLHEYYQRISKIRTVEINSLEVISCICKALEDECVFVIGLVGEEFLANLENEKLIENVIKAFKKNYTCFYYDNLEIYNMDKRSDLSLYIKGNLHAICKKDYKIYNDSIFMYSYHLIDRFI